MNHGFKCKMNNFNIFRKKRKYLEPWIGQNDVRHDKKIWSINKKFNNLDFIKIINFCSTKKALVSLCNDNLENVRYLQTPYGTNDYYLEY